MSTHTLRVMGPDGTQIFGAGLVGGLNFTTSAGELYDKLWVLRYRRNGNATPQTMVNDSGPAPAFHHLLDPTTAPSSFTIIWENMIQAEIALGACRVIAGFVNWITAGVANTIVGIGFYADSNNLWHCFVHDCPTGVAPVTVLHDVATAVLMTSMHRLKFTIDGPTKTITWSIDGVDVSTFTPAAPLDQMGAAVNGPEVVYGAVVPANGDVTVRGYVGSLPLLRFSVLRPV